MDRVDDLLVPAFFAGARVHPLTQLEGRERNGWRGSWWVLSCVCCFVFRMFLVVSLCILGTNVYVIGV